MSYTLDDCVLAEIMSEMIGQKVSEDELEDCLFDAYSIDLDTYKLIIEEFLPYIDKCTN